MPVIYLRHPVHGSKVATLDMEAEYDEQHGWVRYNPDEPINGEDFEPESQPTPNMMAPRRGRPRKVDSVQATDGV